MQSKIENPTEAHIDTASFDTWCKGLDMTESEKWWAQVAWITCSRRAQGLPDDDIG